MPETKHQLEYTREFLEKKKIKELVRKQREFLENKGMIFSTEFKDLESQDPREGVVFDLDGTIVSDEDVSDEDVKQGKIEKPVRPGVQETFEGLQKENLKIVIWTSQSMKSAHKILVKSGLPYDILIAIENYSIDNDDFWEEKIFDQEECRFQQKNPYGKNIKTLGYKIIVSDSREDQNIAKEKEFYAITVKTYNPTARYATLRNNSPLPQDLMPQIIGLLKNDKTTSPTTHI